MDVRVGLWRKLTTEELMLLNCGVGEDSWESLGLQGDPTSPFWRRSVLDKNRHINRTTMGELCSRPLMMLLGAHIWFLCSGRSCKWLSFLVPFLPLSTCFPLHRSQQSMSEASCLCSWAILPPKGLETHVSQRPHMPLLIQWQTPGKHSSLLPQPLEPSHTAHRREGLRSCWFKLVCKGASEHINPARLTSP